MSDGMKDVELVSSYWPLQAKPIRIPTGNIVQYILGVELNDGNIDTKGDLHDETINHRKLCGEGEFDIGGFIDCMDGLGYDGPYGIEVLSAELG